MWVRVDSLTLYSSFFQIHTYLLRLPLLTSLSDCSKYLPPLSVTFFPSLTIPFLPFLFFIPPFLPPFFISSSSHHFCFFLHSFASIFIRYSALCQWFQMDGVGSSQGGILVLGATNVPWELDPGMEFIQLYSRVAHKYIGIYPLFFFFFHTTVCAIISLRPALPHPPSPTLFDFIQFHHSRHHFSSFLFIGTVFSAFSHFFFLYIFIFTLFPFFSFLYSLFFLTLHHLHHLHILTSFCPFALFPFFFLP